MHTTPPPPPINHFDSLPPEEKVRMVAAVQELQQQQGRDVVARLIEGRHAIWLEWNEPWPATAPQGDVIDAHVKIRATVHDCINLARSVAKAAGRPTMGQDEEFLLDFIAIHWASEVR